MAAFTDAAAADGQGRANVLSLPKWTLFIRICQLVLAFLLLILTAYAASKLGSDAGGFGLTWFTFIFTILYFIWLGVSISQVHVAYHPFAHLAWEILLNIFWLSSWAVLASEAASVDDLEGILGSFTYSFLPNGFRSAINCLKASAALGALEWVLFCITLAFLVITFIDYHKHSSAAADVEAAGGGAGAEAKAATEMQNYNNGAGGGVPPPGGAVDPATGYPVQAQAPAQAPYAADPNQAAYPQQAYVDPNQQQAAYAQPPQQYQEQPVTGAAPPQHPTA